MNDTVAIRTWGSSSIGISPPLGDSISLSSVKTQRDSLIKPSGLYLVKVSKCPGALRELWASGSEAT